MRESADRGLRPILSAIEAVPGTAAPADDGRIERARFDLQFVHQSGELTSALAVSDAPLFGGDARRLGDEDQRVGRIGERIDPAGGMDRPALAVVDADRP